MFTIPESRLSASNSAVLASECFLVPMTLRAESRTSQAAFESLRQGFEEVSRFVPTFAGAFPGVAMVTFDAPVSPRVSRIDVQHRGKDHRLELTFAVRCPIPKEKDFWARIQFVSQIYDRLAELMTAFDNRKGIDLYLEEARLDQQKEDPDRLHTFRK